jgi:ribonuclease P protein component
MASASGCAPGPAAPFLPRAAVRAASSWLFDGSSGGTSLVSDLRSLSRVPDLRIPRGDDPRTPRCGFAAIGSGIGDASQVFARVSPDSVGGVVLPQQTRMRRPEEFKRTMRSGRRAGGATLSAHVLLASGAVPEDPEPKVGFVVSRAVGSAVVRNRVKRRLRELMRGRLARLPGGCLLVVRAHPAAAGASQADLAADLDLVLGRLLRRQVGARQ